MYLLSYSGHLNGEAPEGWTFAGWGAKDDPNSLTVNYQDGESIKNLATGDSGCICWSDENSHELTTIQR